jgi:hypothetical protein
VSYQYRKQLNKSITVYKVAKGKTLCFQIKTFKDKISTDIFIILTFRPLCKIKTQPIPFGRSPVLHRS